MQIRTVAFQQKLSELYDTFLHFATSDLARAWQLGYSRKLAKMASWQNKADGKLGAAYIQIVTWDDDCSESHIKSELLSDGDLVHAFAMKKQGGKMCGALLLWENKSDADSFDVEKTFKGATVREFLIHGLTDLILERTGLSLERAKSVALIHYQFGKRAGKKVEPFDPTTEAASIDKKFKKQFPSPDAKAANDVLCPAFANVPGHIVNVFLARPEANSFGGCAFFTNADDRDDYLDLKPTHGVLVPGMCSCVRKVNVTKSLSRRQGKDVAITFERYEVALLTLDRWHH